MTRAHTTARPLRLSVQQAEVLGARPGTRPGSGSGVLATRGVVSIEGPVETADLRRALERVAARHEALRTLFPEAADGGAVGRVVLDEPSVALREIREPSRGEPFGDPLDPAAEPVLEAAIERHSPERATLWLRLPAPCADAGSLDLLIAETAREHRALRGDGAATGGDPLQYSDYAAWIDDLLTAEDTAAGRGFWEGRFAPRGRELRATVLPFERTEGAGEGFAPASVTLRLDAEHRRRLEALAESVDATPADAILAAWQLLLVRLGAGPPAVRVHFDGRHHPELEGGVGLYARSIPVADPGGDSFLERVRRVGEAVRRTARRQDYFTWRAAAPGLEPAERRRLFPVAFAWQPPRPRAAGGGATFELTSRSAVAEPFVLRLACTPVADGIELEIGHDAARLSPAAAELYGQQLRALVTSALDAPETPAAALDTIGAWGREWLAAHAARAAEPDGEAPETPFPELFAAQVRRAPGAPAVTVAGEAGGSAVTYAELAARSARLAHHLRDLGAGPGALVALDLPRSPDLVVAVLGVLQAGAAYLPLDRSHPEARRARVLAEARPRVILTDAPDGAIGAGVPGAARVAIDSDAVAARPSEPPSPIAELADLAYVLHTSGSTGAPKGVMVSHRSLAAYVSWAVREYGLSEGAALVHSPLGFDLTVTTFLAPLAAGGTVALVPEEGGIDALADALAAEDDRALVKLTPSHLEALAHGRPAAGRVATLVVGGEALRGEALASWRAAFPGCRVVNEYGPTEATVGCSVFSIDAGAPVPAGPVPIGRPIGGARLHVVDGALRPAPLGAVGELLIGGSGLARGYLARPAATAERFVPDPFGDAPGSRLYRSGDLVRHLESGELEFVGRDDRQVKVRGHRIELGEVEAVLAGHPGAAEVVVVLAAGRTGDPGLVAYVTPAAGGDGSDLAAALRERATSHLPAPMVPAAFVVLPSFPLTAHGKVDRDRLPEPPESEADDPGAASPLSTPTEELVAELWCELLRLERVGRDDNFVDLGGHSLLAVQLTSRVRRATGVQIPVRRVFSAPTLAQLAARIDDARRESEAAASAPAAPPPIEPAPRDVPPALSYAQRRLWFLDQLDPGLAAFNIPLARRLEGDLKVPALAAALTELARRHEPLRTSFPSEGGVPIQAIAPPAPVPLPGIDLSGLPPAGRAAEAARLAAADTARPFDLARGPVWRARLLRLAPGEHVLLVNMHHIVSDAWSIQVMAAELLALYDAFRRGEPSPLPEPRIQYADFAHWQERWLSGAVFDTQLDYWRRRLAGARVLEIPGDRPRPEVPSYRGATRSVELPADLGDSLRKLARAEGVSLFMALLAAFDVLLYHLTGETDVTVGTDTANRNRLETEGLVGFFVNQLVLRTDLSGGPTFREVLARVKETTLGAYGHEDLPFDRLIDGLGLERSRHRSPLFEVKFLFVEMPDANSGAAPAQTDLTMRPLEVPLASAKNDFTLALSDGREGPLRGWVNYSTDLYDAVTVDRLLRLYEALLGRVVAAPESRLERLNQYLNDTVRRQSAMATAPTRKFDANRFKNIEAKSVALPEGEVVRFGYLPHGKLPRLVEPAAPEVDLVDWARANRERIESELVSHGAVLFRGFGMGSVPRFEAFAGAVCDHLFNENGEHPRESMSGNVYTPVFFPPDQKLLAHNENSFNHRWPTKIIFACAHPADGGGQTPIADSREVYRRLSPETRRKFVERGLSYMRNYSAALGLDWRDVFRADSRAEVEERCEEEKLRYEWRDGDQLRTFADRPSVVRHPRTGEPTWFNQAQHWHISCVDSEVRRSLLSLYAEEDLPRHCYYGDGSPIEDETMEEILQAYRDLEVSFDWQRGDVLLCDNLLVAHGRNPFSGQRKILVSLGDLATYDDVDVVKE